jgi:hypothetical protein
LNGAVQRNRDRVVDAGWRAWRRPDVSIYRDDEGATPTWAEGGIGTAPETCQILQDHSITKKAAAGVEKIGDGFSL